MTSASAAAGGVPRARGAQGVRLGRRRLLVLFGVGIAAVAGIAALVAALSTPSAPKPLCRPFSPCGKPPQIEHRLVNNALWRSSTLGFSVEYPRDILQVSSETPDGVVLQTPSHVATFIVRGRRRADASPQALFDDQLSFLRDNLVGLAADTGADHVLLGSNVGLIPGPGGVYAGTAAAGQGFSRSQEADVMSAGDQEVSVVATVLFDRDVAPDRRAAILQLGDEVFKSVDWRSLGA